MSLFRISGFVCKYFLPDLLINSSVNLFRFPRFGNDFLISSWLDPLLSGGWFSTSNGIKVLLFVDLKEVWLF